eukprot:m.231675 g.231675  ORF g.231675 m.231675 type:complete len:164 (+) comp18442_c0_seq1:115-606(+)
MFERASGRGGLAVLVASTVAETELALGFCAHITAGMSLHAVVRGIDAARRTPKAKGAVITITEKAAEKIRSLLVEHPDKTALKVGVKTKGCSGHQFTLDLTQGKGKFDEEVRAHGATVIIDNNALMKILNSTMDYVADELGEKFVFENPQAKGSCGCGSSFHT